MTTILVFVLALAAAWYVLIVRPQRAVTGAHEELIGSIAIGSHVMTVGGIYGRVEAVEGDVAVIRTGPNTTARIAIDGIARVVSEDHAALEQHQNTIAGQAHAPAPAADGGTTMYGQPQQDPHGQHQQPYPGHAPQQPAAPGQYPQAYAQHPPQPQQGYYAPAQQHYAQPPQHFAPAPQAYAPAPQHAVPQAYAAPPLAVPQQPQAYAAPPQYAPQPYAPQPYTAQVTSGPAMQGNPLAMNYAQAGPPPPSPYRIAPASGAAEQPQMQPGSFAPRQWSADNLPPAAPPAWAPAPAYAPQPSPYGAMQPVPMPMAPPQGHYVQPIAPAHAPAGYGQPAPSPYGVPAGWVDPSLAPAGAPTEQQSVLSEVPEHFRQSIASVSEVREIMQRARGERGQLAEHYRRSMEPLVRVDDPTTSAAVASHPQPFVQHAAAPAPRQFPGTALFVNGPQTAPTERYPTTELPPMPMIQAREIA